MTTTHTHQAIRKYFTSLRHAQILGSLLIGSLVIAGSTFAAPLQIPTLSRANIGIQKIFLSTDGTNTSPGGTTTISLDGTDGDVEIGGLVQMTSYPCTTADCVLTVQAGGGTLKLTGASLSNTTNSTGGELFTKRGGSPLDTGAIDIYFADPVNTNVTGTANDSVKVRIGLQGTGTGTTDAQLIVRGKVESRDEILIKNPTISINKMNLSVGGNGTDNRLNSKDALNNRIKSLDIKSTYTNFPTFQSNIILRSGTGAVSTHVGINTPSGTYATRALDVAGQTLSRQTLEVVSGSSAFYARPSTVSTAGVVGIATNTPNTTDGVLTVSGNTRLFGKTSFIGNQTNLDSTNNGMTSTKLMEINKNTPTTLTLEQVGCKILSVTETGHMVLTQVDASLCTPVAPAIAACGTADGNGSQTIPTTNLCAPGSTASVVSGGPTGPWTWTCTNGASTVSCASSYACDPTIVNATLGSGANGPIYDIIQQPDGKYLMIGTFTQYNGISRNGIVRVNTNGTVDNSFNIGSGFNVALGGLSEGYQLALQPDGKIIAVGWFTNYNGTPSNHIIRLNSNGSVDPTFVVGAGFNNYAQQIYLQPDGTMFILGWFTTYQGNTANRMIKLTATGAIDTSFVMGSSFNDVVYDIATQSDGKIVVGGKFTSYNGTPASFITRLNTNGSVDNTFTIGSAFAPAVGGYSSPTLYTVLVQPDGKILAGGWFGSYNGTPATGLIRLNTDGSVDNGFLIAQGSNQWIIDLVRDNSNNTILAGGGFTTYNGVNVGRMMRLNSNGTLNTSIATNFNGVVSRIKFLNTNDLFIVGGFTQLNNLPGVNRVAIIRMICEGDYDCGTAHAQTFPIAPTMNLCSTGTASAVTSSGLNWLRSCTNGTGSMGCFAYQPTPPSDDGCYTCATGYVLTGDTNNDGIPNCYTGSSNNNNSTGYFSQSRGTSGGWTVTHYADDGTSGPTINIGGGLWSGGVLGSVASPRCGCDIDPLSHDCPPTLYIKTGVTYPDPTQCIDLIGGLGSPNTVGYDYKRGFTARRVPSSGGSNGGNSGNSIISINANYTTGYACTALCGLAHGLSMPNPPSNGGFSTVGGTYYPASPSNLCSTGTASTLSGPTPWTWSCTGLSGAVVSCFANQSTNGLCGSANGQPSVSAPNSNLCSAGTATLVTSTTLANGYSGRSWSCNGTNGGTNASCGGYVPLSCSAVYARDQWTGYYTMSSNTGSWSVPYTAYSTSSSTSLSIPPCAGPGIITPSWDYVGLLNGNYMTTFPWLNGINTSDIVVISGSSTSVINIVPWGAITHPYVLADDVGTSCYVTYHQHPGLHNAIYTKVGYVSDTGENCYPHAESCGPAHGNTYADATAANNAGPLCTNGTTASVASLGGSGPWDRDCLDAGMNVVSSCHADTRAGVCGPADGGLYLDASYANSAGLCNNGIATPGSLVDPGPWTWSCSGTPLVSCNADIDKCTVDPVDLDCSGTNYEPVCGCDNNTYFNDCYAQTAGIGSRTPGACRPESGECGNSIVDMGEQCDDGNNIPNDGCDNSCQLTITVSDLGCADGATMVSYTIGDDDNFDPTVKIQGPYLPNNAYKNWISNYFTQGGAISPAQNLGNMDTNNNNDYYLAHIKLPPAPDPSMRVECIGFELKAKESSSLMSTDSLYLMSKNGAVDENNYGAGLGDYAGLVSQFDAICSMNNSLFIPYAGTNTTVPFTLNVTACPIDIVTSINNGNDDLYLRGQDDHNADYVRIHIGYL